MNTRARREREKQNMKKSILDAATKIIVGEGYDKLTMRRIAEIIDYTPTTIYSYYKDKAQIVDDISKHIYNHIVSDINIVLEKNNNSPIDEQATLAFRTFLYSITDNSEMGKAIIRSGTKAIFGPEDGSIPPEDNGIILLQNLLQKGQDESIFRKLDENMAWMLIAALIGFAINAIENQIYQRENWQGLVNTYVEMLIKGLLA